MIDGVGKSGAPGRIGVARSALERGAPVGKTGDALSRDAVSTPSTPAAGMAASGPPVDAEKIAAIRSAIAEGRYPVDPERIAERMLALDLPVSGDA